MCSAKNDGLVRYPTVLAPASGYKTVNVQCADNANNATFFNILLGETCTGKQVKNEIECLVTYFDKSLSH